MIINKRDKYTYNLLYTVENIQKKTGNEGAQPKDIIHILTPGISQQTVYMTLNALSRDGYLNRFEHGKYTYYSLTDKGKELLEGFKENLQKAVTEPFIKRIADKLQKDYPEEFNNVSYNALFNYLQEKVKKFENNLIDSAINEFGEP